MVMKGPGSIILLRLRGVVNRRFIITLVIKKIYLLKYWNIPGTIFDKKKRPLISQIFRHKKPLRKLLILHGIIILLIPGF